MVDGFQSFSIDLNNHAVPVHGALRSFSIRCGSISGVKAISYKACGEAVVFIRSNKKLKTHPDVCIICIYIHTQSIYPSISTSLPSSPTPIPCLQRREVHTSAILQLHRCMDVVDGMPQAPRAWPLTHLEADAWVFFSRQVESKHVKTWQPALITPNKLRFI